MGQWRKPYRLPGCNFGCKFSLTAGPLLLVNSSSANQYLLRFVFLLFSGGGSDPAV